MTRDERRVLAVNAGSSSIKFALYRMAGAPERVLRGNVDRVGLPGTKLPFEDAVPDDGSTGERGTLDHAAAAGLLLDRLDARVGLASITVVCHRVANGGVRCRDPQRVTRDLLDELRRISAWSPRRFESKGVECLGFHGLSYAFLIEELARLAGAEAARVA